MGGKLATMRAWPALVGCMLALCEAAYAFDYPLSGTKLVIKATPTAGKIAFVNTHGTTWFSVLPGGADDPTLVGGTFRVFDPATGESAVFDLPASNWSARSHIVYKFVNKDAPAGVSPVRGAVHSSFRIRVVVRESGLLLPSGAQQIHVELQLGPNKWCATFADPKKTGAGLFVAGRQATSPASCVDYWTTSTTTTTLAPCGGGPFACGGACDPGLACAPVSDFAPYCGCVPDGTQPCESATQPYCNGTCGGGGTCGPTAFFPGSACICVPPGGTACGLAGPPVCGGECPSGQECQAYDLDTLLFCACAIPGPCGCGMPGTCPGDEWCHIDPPCGCAP